MPPTILGLDIGGANLKAATVDGRAVSVSFALWKQPDRLPAALAELVGQFPDAGELAVTMTGELCDCFETKRAGVRAILEAAGTTANRRPVKVWSTAGSFLPPEEAAHDHQSVAAANWHALATFAGRFAPQHGGLLLDIGSTTTDIIPLDHGVPSTLGTTDQDRLRSRELVYVGVRRTPVCAVLPDRTMAELFATTQDVYVVLGLLPEAPDDLDTADNRPLTVDKSLARLARMLGGDVETIAEDAIIRFATQLHTRLVDNLVTATREVVTGTPVPPEIRAVIVSGAGEFLARRVVDRFLGERRVDRVVSLRDELGPAVSSCAPAHAVAVLATEAS